MCDPAGRVVAQAPAGEEFVLLCDLDLGQVASSHARGLFLGDRRPELYSAWLTGPSD